MIGPVILDLLGPELAVEEREILQHPLVGGVILFSRHYESPSQVADLCSAIRSVRKAPLLISVDQEGGRVQRFREGFTLLPPMRQIGAMYEKNPSAALTLANTCGWLIAAELFSVGVNLSFTPVLDLDRKNSTAIADRAFHSDPEVVASLAKAFIHGMHEVGMAATGKHFPGHGGVETDSHRVMPSDARSYEEVAALDIVPFRRLIKEDLLDAVMPAHISFSAVDHQPVGFSHVWLNSILREKLNFQGVIISDDLNMEGAAAASYAERAEFALQAGCDVILICNNREGAIHILDSLPIPRTKNSRTHLLFRPKAFELDYNSLLKSSAWKERHQRVFKLLEQGELS